MGRSSRLRNHYSDHAYQQYKFLPPVLRAKQNPSQRSQHRQSSNHLPFPHGNDYAIMEEDVESEADVLPAAKEPEDAILMSDRIYSTVDHDSAISHDRADTPPTNELPLPPTADSDVAEEIEAPVEDFRDEIEELLENEEDTISMPPPSRRSSTTLEQDLSEEIPHRRATVGISDLELAFGLWAETSNVTRQSWEQLLEVLLLIKDLSQLRLLPRSLRTLKKNTREQLPLLKLRRKEIELSALQMPTRSAMEKGDIQNTVHKDWVHFFDPIDLVTTMLESSEFTAKIHFGMAHFVDVPSEFYHSESWAASIRATSGEFATYSDNSPLLPSDIVRYHCNNGECVCHDGNKVHVGRVASVGKDYQSDAPIPGAIVLVIQRMLSRNDIRRRLPESRIVPSIHHRELFVIEDTPMYVPESDVVRREASVFLDYNFEGKEQPANDIPEAYLVRYVVNLSLRTLRPIQLSAPPRGELELAAYGRDHFISEFKAKKTLSLPFTLFIDGFGLYRNMYRSLMGVYLSVAGLSARERSRRANVFPLTLGPHGSQFSDVIAALRPALAQLDRGMKLIINGEETLVCAFTTAFIGDMPQQQANSGFLSQNANRPCRLCTITKDERINLDFDTSQFGRYHYRVLKDRAKADRIPTLSQRTKFLKGLGMKKTQSPLTEFTPCLDIIRTRPADAAHSEYAGIAKQSIELLFTAILTSKGQERFTLTLQQFPFPPTWGRLQSPRHHLQSYRMQEAGRASIIVPVLLRCWLEERHIQPGYLRAIERTRTAEILPGRLSSVDMIVYYYAAMARSNSVLLARSSSEIEQDALPHFLRESRRAFQKLYESAALATESRRGESPASASQVSVIGSEVGDEEEVDELGGEYEELARASILGSTVTKKGSAFGKFLSRPNVHVAIHYPDVIAEYGTASNCSTFSGEDKHRDFKRKVLGTNHREVVKALLLEESVQQSIRFVLSQGFVQSMPEITERLLRIHARCPTLLNNILPVSERLELAYEPQIDLLDDSQHKNPTALGCISRKYVTEIMKMPLWPSRLPVNHSFLQKLRVAYHHDYGEESVMQFPKSALQWCKKLSFIDDASEHRLTFKLGDFVLVRSSVIARLDHIFLHELTPARRRLFALVTKVRQLSPDGDRVLHLPLLELEEEQEIIGLPAIAPNKLYILPVKPQQQNSGALLLGGNSLLLFCHWDIDYM